MGLVNAREIYTKARQRGYGIGGFVAENMEMILAILYAAEETRSPVVFALWEKDIEYAGEGALEVLIKNYASKSKLPIAIMLDHGTSLQSCLSAVQFGHTCVMMDASHESFEQNIKMTLEVSRAVQRLGIMVEGEIGTIRRTFENVGEYSDESVLTDPELVGEFVAASKIDAIAVSVGNESGISDQSIDIPRLCRIAKRTDAFIILHGGSCTPDSDIEKAIACGATGFRFASENRIVYLDAIEKYRRTIASGYADTRLIYGRAVQEVKGMIIKRMVAMGCAGQAW